MLLSLADEDKVLHRRQAIQGELVNKIIGMPQVRLQVIGLVLAGLCFSPLAQALGLGAIEIHSALNQPLEAEIEILGADRDELDELEVSLASSEAFTRVGLDRPFLLTKLEFTVGETAEGSPIVEVTSPLPIREPFLSFLVRAEWPQGRLFREYTVLLDPPAFAQSQPAPATSQAPTQPAGRPAAAPTSARPAEPTQYRVQANDTLWRIAQRVSPADTLTVEQVMLGIQRANPAAFINNNINGVRRGAVLEIPSAASLQRISPQEAQAEVREQMASWRAAQPTAQAEPATEPAQPQAAADRPAAAETQQPSAAAPQAGADQLDIVGAEEKAATAEAEADQPNETARLRERLELTREESDALQQENEALSEANQVLEDRLNTLNSRLQQTEQQLAQAEQSLTAKESTLAELRQQLESTRPQQTKADPLEWLTSPLGLALTGIIGLTLILLGGLVWRRQQQAKQAQEDEDFPDFELPETAAATTATRRTEAAEAVPQAPSGQGVEVDFTPPPPTEETERQAPPSAPDEEAEELPTTPAAAPPVADDILAEANVYLAYGLHQQAEDLLRKSVQRYPEREDYRLKLLETLHGAKDRAGFVKAAEEWHRDMEKRPAPDLWAQALALGHEIDSNHPLFGGESGGDDGGAGLAAKPAPSSASQDDFDDVIDLGDEFDELTATTESAKRPPTEQTDQAASNELDFNIEDLDYALGEAGSDTTESAPGTAETDSMSLDFDFEETATEQSAKTLDSTLDSTEDTQTGTYAQSSDTEQAESSASGMDETLILDVGDLSELETQIQAAQQDQPKAETGGGEDTETELSFFDVDTETFEKASDRESSTRDTDTNLGEMELSDFEIDLGKAEEATDPGKLEEDLRAEPADETTEFLGDFENLETFSLDTEEMGITGGDELDTKLELAQAYVDMGDGENARSLLNEVMEEGSDTQQAKAKTMLAQID